jgi:hypothetical protein
MVGFVCFEIRGVLVTPEKIIKGRFLCPSDPLFAECPIGPAGSGGEDFGIRTDFPVLVRRTGPGSRSRAPRQMFGAARRRGASGCATARRTGTVRIARV